jgi:hypothetical protein
MEGSGSVKIITDPDPGDSKSYGFYGSRTLGDTFASIFDSAG